MASASPRALWAFLFGNLVIGTGVLLPAGMLTAIMADFGVDAARAGLLMLTGGIVVGVGAPLVAATTYWIDRRLLLVAALALFAVGHIGATTTSDFNLLLFWRALTIVGAAIFTPQAAATVGLIVPASARSGGIAFIFIGWSLASVAGIPLGSLLADLIGWRETSLGLAAFAALAAVGVALTVPRGLISPRLDLAAWGRVLTDPVLLIVLCVTLLSITGQFVLFTYLTPLLKGEFAATATMVSVTFLIVGAMGVIGNWLGARVSVQAGVARTVLGALGLMAAGLVVVALGFGSLTVFIIGGALWGLGSFAANSLQQSRLVALAPALASATVALNTSAVYLGQAVGSWVGGPLVKADASLMPWAAAGFLVAAMAASVLAAGMRKGQ
jgi:MFS transporter, DHA1 family, inner membrane transport protein